MVKGHGINGFLNREEISLVRCTPLVQIAGRKPNFQTSNFFEKLFVPASSIWDMGSVKQSQVILTAQALRFAKQSPKCN